MNPAHVSPDAAYIQAMVTELGLTPGDGDAYLLQQCILEALDASRKGRYGVAALLAETRGGVTDIICKAQNQRGKGLPDEYVGHAETVLVRTATPHFQFQPDRTNDTFCVNLCPCPGCIGPMVDAHVPDTIIGSIDPQVGAAFLKGVPQQYALGIARQQVVENRGLKFRFPDIKDPQVRNILLTSSWDAFHCTRGKVHRAEHQGELKE